MNTVRRLERELGLGHTIMLGTAGTIAASIFVLTGPVAERMGPASVGVLLLLGILNISVALNFSELSTTYPVTGGALTYVREAYGTGLLAFLVGSLDCLSGAFYGALSAIGFAYSLEVIVPWIPIVPTALVVIGLFTILNVLGTNYVGRAQLLLGGVLLAMLVGYVVVGFLSPTGFSWDTYMPTDDFFIRDGFAPNVLALFGAFALVFNAFVGFDIIADDAEEVINPNRNLPIAILTSLGLVTLIYVTVTLVTLGTIPWSALEGSNQALSIAADKFLPRWGAPLIAFTGIIATLTSANTAILAATHESLSLAREGLWPRFMSRLGRLRTPYAAALSMGAIAALMATIGVVEFLSYISSTGYLFVTFWASVAMLRLHKLYPNIERPFKAPLFPLTPYLAMTTSVIATAFASPVALTFLGGLLIVLTALYFLRAPLAAAARQRAAAVERVRNRLLVAVANPNTAVGLASLAANLSEEQIGSPMEILAVAPGDQTCSGDSSERRCTEIQRALLRRVAASLQGRNVPFYTEVRTADDVVSGILEEIHRRSDIRLLLMGWPGHLGPEVQQEHPVGRLLKEASVDMAVFLNRGIVERPQRILVPFGGGVHARLALRLAIKLVAPQEGEVVALRFFNEREREGPEEIKVIEDSKMVDVAVEELSEEHSELHDEMMLAYEEIEAGVGRVPDNVSVKVVADMDIAQGTQKELMKNTYDLVVIGAALAHTMESDLFGSLTTAVAESVPTSVLLVRRYEPEPVTWVRRQVKEIVEQDNGDHDRYTGASANDD